MKVINSLALLLVIVGAIVWGLIGFFNINIITSIFSTTVSKVIFALVGLAGLWSISFFKKLCCCHHHSKGVCSCCNKNCDSCNCCKK